METLPALAAEVARIFEAADFVALVLLIGTQFTMSVLIEHSGPGWPSTSRLMERYRRAWMEQLARREARVFDASLLTTLRNGSAFFASTCLIAVGGVLALLGQTERALAILSDLGAGAVAGHGPVWEAKLLVILVLMVSAFLQFVWSHRLFGYAVVLFGAMPEWTDEAGRAAAVDRASRLQVSAARSFNRGLRAVYFALAGLAWFLGPFAMMLATGLTAAMLVRREFFSASRRALMSR